MLEQVEPMMKVYEVDVVFPDLFRITKKLVLAQLIHDEMKSMLGDTYGKVMDVSDSEVHIQWSNERLGMKDLRKATKLNPP